MNRALYRGWVSHRRLLPRAHGFRYRMGMLYLDLAEQPQVLGLSWLAGHSRWAAFAFRETDYLPHATHQGMTLSDAVRQRVEQALGHAPQGRICLLTQPRSWGLSFNPISLFYCFETDGSLAAILCEVSNTPWRERYHYVLPTHATGESRHRVAKSFHVSPFLPRDLEYRMHFSAPDQKLHVTMQDWQGEQKMFEAGLGLERIELTRQSRDTTAALRPKGMSERGQLLLNAGLFQLGWFACVFGAQRPWLLLIAIACLAIHLLWIANDLNEWRSLLRVAACGWVLDSVLLHLGLFYFSGAATFLPLWLAMLWLLFASTLRHSLSWTKRPWWMGSLLGALGGAKLAGVGLPLGVWPSVLLLALIWAMLMPALHWMTGQHAR